MTPLLELSVRGLADWKGPWDAGALGITGPQGLLSAISAAKVFVIDEAETDTTTARDLHPGYFATTTGFYLPAPVCWYEYKAYRPVDGRLQYTGARSAFLATAGAEGIIVFLISQLPGGWAIMPGFGFDKAMERSPEVRKGKVMQVGIPKDMPEGYAQRVADTGANFFLELVELVNMPAGIRRTDTPPSHAFRRRLAAAMNRVDFDLQPVTHVSLDQGDLLRRARSGAA